VAIPADLAAIRRDCAGKVMRWVGVVIRVKSVGAIFLLPHAAAEWRHASLLCARSDRRAATDLGARCERFVRAVQNCKCWLHRHL